MKPIILIDVVLHLLVGIFLTWILWPYFGSTGLTIMSLILLYLAYAWMKADLIVAGRAGFRNPTIVQRRYLEHLGINELVTYPPIDSAFSRYTRVV